MNMATNQEARALASVLAGTVVNGTWYHAETPRVVINALEYLRDHDDRVRLFYGDTKTGKAWAEENDVVGRISRSTGERKIPLLIANARSHGGGALLDHCIVAILQDRTWRYRHQHFDVGQWTYQHAIARTVAAGGGDGHYPHHVLHNGELQARFETEAKALRYIDFMRGKRMGR